MSRKRHRSKRSSSIHAAPVPPRAAAAGRDTPTPRPGWLARLRRKLRDWGEVLVIPGIIVGFFLAIFLLVKLPEVISLLHQETVVDTVVRSERVASGESSKYLVFGAREVYQNTDNLPLRKFNSSDYYRDIEVGKTYRFEVIGWRIPFFSLYRNIVGFEEVAAGTE